MATKEHHSFFRNTGCEFFPCHPGAERKDFNCLFCYCPLYALGEDCGGDYIYLESGVKDCSSCLFPHERKNYPAINARFDEIAKLAARKKPTGE